MRPRPSRTGTGTGAGAGRERIAFSRLYRGQTNYDFINRWRYWFAMSGTVILIGLIALGVRGLNFSIDFRGGTVWEVPTNASVATVRGDLGAISPLLNQATITQLTNRETGHKNIEVQAPANVTSNAVLVSKVTSELAKLGGVPKDDVTLNAIGPSWGSAISSKAIEAVVVFLVLISICIAVYFETKMAIGALVALLHDMLITVGIYALSGFQVSPDTVIAFLTVLGYSLYDTIVVFDKVKENTKGLASTNRNTYTDVVNLSMNQVLARSINTSFVSVMPVFCILVIGSWILGASALNDFGLALFIGLMSGAYSSIFIASPILAILKEREPRYVEIRKRLAAYPQSRQVLTPSTVADGMLVGTRVSSSQGGAPGGGAGSRSGAVPGGGWSGGALGAPQVATLPASDRGPATSGAPGLAGAAGVAGVPGLGGGGSSGGGGGGNGGSSDTTAPAGAGEFAQGAGGRAFESYAGPVRPGVVKRAGAVQGGKAQAGKAQSGRAQPSKAKSGTAAGGEGVAAGASTGAGVPEGGSAGTGAAKAAPGRPPVPPRPRRKVPRHR